MTADAGRLRASGFHIWEGVYDSFDAARAAAKGAGFDGSVWRERALSAAKEVLAAVDAAEPIPPFHKQRSTMLPPVVAMMLASRDSMRILDFGGGLGIGYLSLREALPGARKRISYSVVDVPSICQDGRELFDDQIEYLDRLPESGPFDLVHAASSIQYVPDWRATLSTFAQYSPEYVLLSDVFAGDVPSYVTLQNYYDSQIPHWILNLPEFLEAWERAGYGLVMRTFVTSKRLGVEDYLPMEAIPPMHRIGQTLHLLLRRQSGTA